MHAAIGAGLVTAAHDCSEGGIAAALAEAVDGETAAIFVQQPNFLGGVEDVEALAAVAKESGALVVVSCDPVALSVLKPPGECGADVAVGEGQRRADGRAAREAQPEDQRGERDGAPHGAWPTTTRLKLSGWKYRAATRWTSAAVTAAMRSR